MQTSVVLACALLAALLPAASAGHDQPCDKGYVQSGPVKGSTVKLAGLDAYVTAPAARRHKYNKYPAVVLITDIYGYKLNNTQLWADRLAKAVGCIVIVPDLFRGDPWTEARNRSEFTAWLAKFPETQVLSDLDRVLKEVRDMGVNGYKVSKFGAQGFCWGGRFSALLVGKQPWVSAAIAYHPSRLVASEIDAVSAPLYFLLADPDLDQNFPNQLFQSTVAVVDSKRCEDKLDVRIRSYEGMAHGFTLRGDMNNATIKAASDDAFKRGAQFLAYHLKH